MAEALAIAGAAIAAVDITLKLATALKKLWKCIKDADSIPEEIDQYYKECSLFSKILHTVDNIAKDIRSYPHEQADRKTQELANAVVQLCKAIEKSARVVVKCFADVRWSEANILEKLRCRLQWHINKPDMVAIRLSLLSSQNSLSLLLGLYNFEWAVKQTAQGQTLTHRIAIDRLRIHQQLQQQEKYVAALEARWIEQKAAFESVVGRQFATILDFSNDIRKYVKSAVQAEMERFESCSPPVNTSVRNPDGPGQALKEVRSPSTTERIYREHSAYLNTERSLVLARPLASQSLDSQNLARHSNSKTTSRASLHIKQPRPGVVGVRVRDRGDGQPSDEFGEWPSQVIDLEDLDDATQTTPESTRQASAAVENHGSANSIGSTRSRKDGTGTVETGRVRVARRGSEVLHDASSATSSRHGLEEDDHGSGED
ncbi:hypothetical protein Micbo1qcDRAFT_197656, partial [Microdochium bolleyi]